MILLAIKRILNIQQIHEVLKDEAAVEAQRRMAEIIADLDIWNCCHHRFITLSLQFI
jgi:hypothetical protein